jgi:hypothetical protein
MGFLESWSKGWSFIKAAFAMAGENKRLLLPSLYQVLVTIGYFVAWVAALIAIHPHWSNGVWIGVGTLATFGSFLIFYFFCGITVNMVDFHLRGGQPTVGDGAKVAGKNLLALVYLAIVSAIIDTFARMARSEDSIFGRIIAGIVESIWTTLSFLLLPAIIIENAGFGEAMKRVRALHKGNMLVIGLGEVGVRGVTGLIGFSWFLLIFGFIYLDVTILHGAAAAIVGVSVAGAMFAIYAAFSTYLRMAYYTCLYLWAVDVELKGADAPAPLPLAIALGRRAA